MFVNAKLRFVVGVVTTLPRILDQLYLAEHLGQVVFSGHNKWIRDRPDTSYRSNISYGTSCSVQIF